MQVMYINEKYEWTILFMYAKMCTVGLNHQMVQFMKGLKVKIFWPFFF